MSNAKVKKVEMSISNKISEIKIIVAGFLQDLDSLDKDGEINLLKWEELNISAGLIMHKLNTLYAEYVRSATKSYVSREELGKEVALRNEEIKKLNQTITELKRSFSDVTLNISKAFIPGKEHITGEPQSLKMEVEEEMELFSDNGRSIFESARGDNPDWMIDNPGPAIDSVSQAITLNDKLLFLNELFNEDNQQYRLSLERIDQMSSFDEVLEYTRESFSDWDENSNAVYRFYMAVRRKFN